jgi:beta-N-acetylhexosaminidase
LKTGDQLKKVFTIFLLILMLGVALYPPATVFAQHAGQADLNQERAGRILQAMSPEERVGQVFLVSFTGSSLEGNSQLQQLIRDYHVGGVVLRYENDNFTGPENTITRLQGLITDLQSTNLAAAKENESQSFPPLLVGITQEGDLYPGDAILNGITQLPNQMTIGATWNAEFAQEIGKILGSELSSLGINLLFGPSLDVLDTASTYSETSLGTRSFGSEPYWVGKMGQAYIKGIHEGSENKMAVIATHFPGIGSSDRHPEEEIATVRKSLELLKQVDLAPFFTVTNLEQPLEQVADGLLLSHTRYQGFQGNILSSTKPVSFDANALETIMELPELAPWRTSGGVIISDDLGSEAVRKFVDPLGTGYDARQVARTALMAGNDMLYMGNILASGDPDSYTTVTRTINYFVQKYQEDSAFRIRVDQAATNIIALKLRIFPSFSEEDVLPDSAQLEAIGQQQELVEDVVQAAVTLISPEINDLGTVLTNPPDINDHIVILSGSTSFAQCSTCDAQTLSPSESIFNSLIRLYGAGAGDPIQSSNLNTISYERVRLLLEQAEGVEEVQVLMNSADWIIFTFTNFEDDQLDTTVFRRLFNERQDLVRNKKIIGMAFSEPYNLDATDISKFSAYYSFYTKISQVYDLAARVLLQELTPTGSLPVSMQGTGYDLAIQTSPDPTQVIPLIIEAPVEANTPVSTPPTGYSQPLLYEAGDTIPIKAGLILDHNGNPVPDGTVVNFIIDTMSTSGSVEQLPAETIDGYARVMYVIPSIGSLELRVTADPARTSQILRLDITDAGGVVTSFEPTVETTEEVEPTPTEIPPAPTPQKPIKVRHLDGKPAFSDWLLVNLMILGICALMIVTRQKWTGNYNRFVSARATGTGGYLAYLYVAFGLPGAQQSIIATGTPYILFTTFIGMLIGFEVAFIYNWIKSRKKQINGSG